MKLRRTRCFRAPSTRDERKECSPLTCEAVKLSCVHSHRRHFSPQARQGHSHVPSLESLDILLLKDLQQRGRQAFGSVMRISILDDVAHRLLTKNFASRSTSGRDAS